MVGSERARALQVQARGRLVLLLAVPVLIGTVMWLVAVQEQQRARLVRHTLLVELSLQHLLSELRTAEASQRGFSLTGGPEFHSSFQTAADAVRGEVTQLTRLTADNQNEQAHLARLRPLLDERLTRLTAAMAQVPGAASRPPGVGTGPARSGEPVGIIRNLVNEMSQEEQRLLLVREAGLRSARKRFYWSLFLGYGLIVVIVASLYRAVKLYSIRSAQAEAGLSALNAELDERVSQRTALLHAREELLNIFVRYVPAAVAMLDKDMHYLQVSDRWCADYGLDRERFIGHSHYEAFPDLPDRWKEIHNRCLRGEMLRVEEDRWERNGRVVWMRWEIRPWGARDGLPEGILIFTEDITARKQIEEALRESEATNRTLLDTASEAILAVDSSGIVVLANRMAGEIFGYSPGELVGQHHDILVPEALRDQHREQRAAFAADPRSRIMGTGLELTGLRKDGTRFPIEVSLSGLETKRGFLAVSFVSDITVRKEAETQLLESEQKLRALAGSLLTAQEEERSKLARELHDDLTQQLAFLSIEVGRLAAELPDSMSDLRVRMRALQAQTARASSEVRRISHGLHPSIIKDFGLSVALEDFCMEFEKAHQVSVAFEGSPDDALLNDAVATCLYRIAQESMRNARIHGHASQLCVTLSVASGSMRLQVQDNGTGLSAEELESKTGLGLVSMMERIRLVNGTLDLSSEVGRGTTITASVPLEEDRHEAGKSSGRRRSLVDP